MVPHFGQTILPLRGGPNRVPHSEHVQLLGPMSQTVSLEPIRRAITT